MQRSVELARRVCSKPGGPLLALSNYVDFYIVPYVFKCRTPMVAFRACSLNGRGASVSW